jgi:hypothetical protein
MTKKMLVIYVLQFLGLIVNGVRQNLITDQMTSTVVSTGDREVLNSIQGVLFVALANSAERDLTVKPVASKPSEDVFYCNQQGHFARTCPHKGIPTATATTPKAQDCGKTQ